MFVHVLVYVVSESVCESVRVYVCFHTYMQMCVYAFVCSLVLFGSECV